MRSIESAIDYAVVTVLFLILSFSNPRLDGIQDRVQILAANHAFDFFTWTANAAWVKITQSSIDSPHYLSSAEQHHLVIETMQIIRNIEITNDSIDLIFSDPNINNPEIASENLRKDLEKQKERLDALSPFAEATLEIQVSSILSDLGLTLGGQPVPWVLYHTTPLPQNLVISLREKISTASNYILNPLTTPDAANLENSVDERLNVSSLVVEIGGLAAYPTMIMRTNALGWLSETIAHEWTHLYLGTRPLGLNYNTPELRTMNETTASIAGKEIGQILIQRYYPELLSNYLGSAELASLSLEIPSPPSFNFRTEMHTTRVNADELLAQGKINEAEAYMEKRRQLFWDHGYTIRKLNQAYFAFYGSYADTPGGAAGEDPVGPAVRALRSQSSSLKEFLERISAMTSFAELQKAVNH
jgi:hypothetical protein